MIAHYKQQIAQQQKLKEQRDAINAQVLDYSSAARTSQGSFILKSPTGRPTVPLKEISEENGSIQALLPSHLTSNCVSSIALQDTANIRTDQYYQSLDTNTVNSRDQLGDSQRLFLIKPPGVELRKVCNSAN